MFDKIELMLRPSHVIQTIHMKNNKKQLPDAETRKTRSELIKSEFYY